MSDRQGAALGKRPQRMRLPPLRMRMRMRRQVRQEGEQPRDTRTTTQPTTTKRIPEKRGRAQGCRHHAMMLQPVHGSQRGGQLPLRLRRPATG